MSYTPPRRTAFVTFEEGHTYHGAEITLSLDVAAAVLFEMQSFGDLDGGERADMIRRFGDEVLIEWNLEAPANGDGLLAQPMAFVNVVFEQWIEAQGLEAPLVEPSAGTTQSARARSTLRAMPSSSLPKRRAR